MARSGRAPAESVQSFGGFVLDLARTELRDTTGCVVPLRAKTRTLLGYLLSRAGHVVSRDAILDAVWPGVTVGHESVDQAVSELRRALGAEGPQLIRTVPAWVTCWTRRSQRTSPPSRRRAARFRMGRSSPCCPSRPRARPTTHDGWLTEWRTT
jgi:hypothetical protein